MPKIVFTDIFNETSILEKPKPAKAHLPKWYKDAEPYINGKRQPRNDLYAGPNIGIKKCMPVFDAITSGYIITTPYDINVKKVNGQTHYEWGGENHNIIVFQPIEQMQGHPEFEGDLIGTRLNHPWSVTTPNGYSILVMQPAHRVTPFIVFPGIVDTDSYNYPFNTFFRLRDPDFEGVIPAGTEYCQIIPFKRENWTSGLGGEKEKKKAKIDYQRLTMYFFDKYKRFWWSKKSYN